MSRDSRESLLANDSLAGASDAAYSNLGSAESDRQADDSSSRSSLGRGWHLFRHKPLYLLALSLVIALPLIWVAYKLITHDWKHDEPPPDSPPYNPETPWLYARLPNATRPIHYSLLEEINVADFQYRGAVNITVNITRPVDHIVLHVLGLTWLEVTLTLDNATVLTPVAWLYEPNSYLVLNFSSMVPEQRAAVLHIGFAATLISYPYAGLYAASYKNSTNHTVYMAVTQFAATDARRAFPCFDEPAMKATFDITIISAPAWPTVLSNMPAVSTSTRASDGWLVTTFDRTPIMSTYLVAFTVTDFGHTSAVSSCTRPITTRVFAPRHLVDWTNTTVHIGAAVIAHYCQYFEIDYPLPKEDHFVVPQFFYSAMENWGLIAYRFDALLLQPNAYTVAQLQRVAQVVAHELAHQWFGNLVTAAWWSEIWLNEGFASFVQYIGLEWAVPMLDARDQFLITEERRAMLFDSNPRAHPVIDLTTQSGNFDEGDYQKGASLLRMLQGVLGSAVWLKGINAYVQSYKYSNARSVDLFTHLTQAANESGQSIDVSAFMARWTEDAGFPLVSCTTRAVGANSTQWQCTQKRYYANPPPASPDTSTAWDIYLTFTGAYTERIYWHWTQPTITFTAPSTGFVKLNANSTGYYRVLYDEYGWQQLSMALNATDFGGMSADDRLGVVMDSLVFARDERITWRSLLPLLQFLQYETHWPTWSIAAPSLLNLYSLMSGKNDGLAAIYQSYLQQQLNLVARSLNTSRNNSPRDKFLYTVLSDAIVRFDVGGRRAEFVERFAELQAVPAQLNVSDLPVDEVDLVLRSGVWAGAGSGAQWVFDALYWPAVESGNFESVDPRNALSYNQLLAAMAASNNDAEVDWLLHRFGAPNNGSNPDPPTEHRVTMLGYLARSDKARPRFNGFVECCLALLTAALPASALSSVVRTLVQSQWEAADVSALTARLNGAVDGLVWNATLAGNVTATENIRYSTTVYPDISQYIRSMQWVNG